MEAGSGTDQGAQTVFQAFQPVGFGVGTSLLSGLYSAWKAANERPVEALRS